MEIAMSDVIILDERGDPDVPCPHMDELPFEALCISGAIYCSKCKRFVHSSEKEEGVTQ